MKDGWHKLCGYDIYVENNRVIRGTLGGGLNYRPAYPFKHYKGCSGWHNVAGELTVSAFRYGIKRGTVIMN